MSIKYPTYPLVKHNSVLLPERLTDFSACPFGTRFSRASPECYPITVPDPFGSPERFTPSVERFPSIFCDLRIALLVVYNSIP